MPKQPLTAERLRQILNYEPDTGIFTWRVTTSNRALAGSVAGHVHRVDGRIYIGVDRMTYKAHRLAWLYTHGQWPQHGIDHRDGVVTNNAIKNLRPADQAANSQNLRRAHRDSSVGLLGVQRSGARFRAVLKAGPVRVFCVSHESPEEAHIDYLELKSLFHPFNTIGPAHV